MRLPVRIRGIHRNRYLRSAMGLPVAPGRPVYHRALLSLLLVGSGALHSLATGVPTAQRGVLDLRNVDWGQQEVALTGEWKWYWKQLRSPGDVAGEAGYVRLPQLWNSGTWHRLPVASQGYATYRLTVLLPPASTPLAMLVPDQYTAYRLFVNGREAAHDGNPATTPTHTRPRWSTQLIDVPASDTLELVLQVANFDHAKGGAGGILRLGEARHMATSLATDQALDLFLVGCVFMTGLFFLGVFQLNQTERASLYFGLFCLVYSYRIVGTGTYPLHTLVPDLPWQITLRFEYVTLYAAVALFIAYSQALYPKDVHLRLVRGMKGLCLTFAATALLLPSELFTRLMTPFLVLMVGYVGYALYVYGLAARRGRPGSVYSLGSTGLLLSVFGLIIADYFGLLTFPKVGLFAGYLCFFFLQSLILLFRFVQMVNLARQAEKQFLANMSHEIRTPLNAILGFSTLLEAASLTDESQEYVRYIRTAGKNLLVTVNDILDIAKIEDGNVPLERVPFSVHALVDSIQTMLLPAATAKNLTLSAALDPALPPVLLGDPTRLTQILINLLSNAIKFTRQGSVSIAVEGKKITAETTRVRFVVKDTGIGIAADVLPHIFERFRQANNSITRHYGGTGLGLSIVKSLTELQGGVVNVTSVANEGSCFSVEITYAVSSEPVQDVTDEGAATRWESAGVKLTILVVEDNLMNQKLAVNVLNRLGHTPEVVENGQQALERISGAAVDLVLMDLQMPVMDGYTATYHIRNTLRSSVPIIAMTAHALTSERERCLQAGMNDFLSKPFQPDELQRIIRKHLPAGKPGEGQRAADTTPLVTPAASDFSVIPLLEVVGGDTAIAIELLELFESQTVEQAQLIRQALTANDAKTISGLIHKQKPTVKLLNLTGAGEQIRVLETMLPTITDLTDVAPLVNQYLLTLEADLRVIGSFVETNLKQSI